MKERTVLAGGRCRRPQCWRGAMSRGLCGSCYQVAYQLVTSGATTWEELEKRGKADSLRRNAKSWFLETE